MATYNITTAETTGLTLAAGDSVIIDSPNGSLNVTTVANAITGAGGNILSVAGTLAGSTNAFYDTNSDDQISVSSSGKVLGGTTSAIDITGAGGSNSLSNAGSITTHSTGGDVVYLNGGDNTVSNSGTIKAADYGAGVDFNDGNSNHLTNSGTIAAGTGGDGVDFTGANEHLTNSAGSISSATETAVGIAGDNAVVSNAGTISGFDSGLYIDGSDTNTHASVTNGGTIEGYFDGVTIYGEGVGGVDTLENKSAGVITGGEYGVYVSGDSNTVINHGAIETGASGGETGVAMRGDFETLHNSGTISDGNANSAANDAVDVEGYANSVANAGTITGEVYISGESDNFTSAKHTFNGELDTNYAYDGSFILGKGTDHVETGSSDFYQAGSGKDTFVFTLAFGDTSTSTDFDTINDFNASKDVLKFQLHNDSASINGSVVTVSGELNNSGFDVDLADDIGSKLKHDGAVVVDVTSGNYKGDTFLVVDGNGHVGYQAGDDYVVELTNETGTLSTSNIEGHVV